MSAQLTAFSRTPERCPTAALLASLNRQRGSRCIDLIPVYGARHIRVALNYLWCGAPEAPTVIVQGGISADRDVSTQTGSKRDGWWQALVGEGCALDLRDHRVLAINWLAPPELGDAPSVSTADQANALAALIDALGIGRVAGFVGASYGAMVGLAFAALHPSRLERLVVLAGAHRAHPLSTALRSVQRGIVRLGQSSGRADEALGLARQLAMTTYRGSEEFAHRFTAAPEFRENRFHFPVEDYLDHAGRRYVQRFDAARFLALSESIDLHDVKPESVTTPTTLIGFASDRVVPLADLCELQRRLGAPATLEVMESIYGHDGFLKETNCLAPLLRQALGSDPMSRKREFLRS